MKRLKANYANLKVANAVNIQAHGLTYLSLQYCNMGDGTTWNVRGCEIKNYYYYKPGNSDTDIWSNTRDAYLYPADMELWLEGNNIRFHVYNNDEDDEDVGFWFRMGYVNDKSRTVFKNTRSGNGNTRCGVKLRTEDKTHFWSSSEGTFSLSSIPTLENGKKYHIEFWSTDEWNRDRVNHHYFYPFC